MVSLVCLVLRHKRASDVWHDRLEYRADCRRCETELVRDRHSRKWRPFNSNRDANPARRDLAIVPQLGAAAG